MTESARNPMSEHPDVVSLQQQFGGSLSSPQTVLGDGLLALSGVWVALSPWILGFTITHPEMAGHNLVLGLVVAAIGLGLTGMAERGGGLSWVAVPLGIWLIVSTWIVPVTSSTTGMIWSNLVAGIVMVLTAAGVAGMALMGGSRGGTS